MKTLKPILFGLTIGVLLGLWFGVNIGKDQSIFSNPFAERDVGGKIKSTIGEGVERAGEKLEKLGTDIQGKPKDQ